MRKLIVLPLIILLAGCVSAQIPKYLNDDVSYTKKFYSDYNATLSATKTVLKELGWKIAETSDPAVYDHSLRIRDEVRDNQILIFTDIRQTPLFVGTRYAKMNILIKELADNNTQVDIRYLTVNSTAFKNIESYKNESAVKRIFKRITEVLGQS